MAGSFSNGWKTLKPYYSEVSMDGWVNWRSGSRVNVTIRAWSRGIQGAWWADSYHVYFTVSTDAGGSSSIDMGAQWNSGQSYTAERSFTLNVGYGAGGTTCRYSASQSWSGSYSASDSAWLSWDSTYTKPSPPAITGYSSTNGYQERMTFNRNDSFQAAIYECNIDRFTLTETNTPTWSGVAVSSPYTTSGTKNGAAIVSRIATNAYVGGWQASGTALMLQAPTNPTSFSVVANTTFGASFSWKNTHNKTDYYTYLYEGTVTVGSNGKLSTGSAKLLAKLAPGVTTYSNAKLWAEGGGQSTKTFTLVQVSSYKAWKRTDKASFKTSGYMLEGFASSVLKVSLTNGAMAPSAATNVTAANVMADGKVSNTQAVIKWSAVASTSDRPRTGWRIRCNGVQVDTFADTTAGSKTRTVTVSISGKSATFVVEAYGIAGTAAATATPVIYGQLPALSGISATRRGREITVTTTQNVVGEYSSSVEIGYSLDNSTWTTVSGSSFVVNGDAYSNAQFYFRTRAIPAISIDKESHASDYITTTCSPGTDAVQSITATQDNDYPDGSHCVATWTAVKSGSTEVPDKYELYYVLNGTEHKIVTVAANGSATYTHDFLWMAAQKIFVRVYAIKNGWYSLPCDVEYQYNPQYLEPPQLVSIEHDAMAGTGDKGYYYILHFRHATGGIMYNSGASNAGYKYTLYIDGVKADYQDPPSSSVIAVSNVDPTITMKIISPRPVYVRLTATDEQRESGLSNSLSVQYQAGGVGLFLYQCPNITIEDCLIENVGNGVRAMGGSSVSMTNCTVKLKDGAVDYYDMDEGSSIFELNGEYE